MHPDITLAITSCNRHDLLERTLRSFADSNACPISATVIVEDSELQAPGWLAGVRALGSIQWITNGRRKGQIYSVDRAYAEVTTPYVFHLEDDWEFVRSGFIEESLEILEQDATIWTVSLRGNDCNGHPNASEKDRPFAIQEPYWRKHWGGCNWNPGLRRLADYERIGSYGRLCGYGQHGVLGEQTLSKLHLDMGYRIAVLPELAVKHIGGHRSRAAEKFTALPKVLIAIPACHAYQYGNLEHGINRQTDDRPGAQRSTWLEGVPAFGNVDYKFFYGCGAERSPEKDEIFLDCADDYPNLPHKMQAIYRWALAHDYDYVFKCDDDTFVYLDRLMASGFEQWDYTGFCYPARGNYISGGCGYWLSRRALGIMAATPPNHWAEDLWTGRTLAQHDILPHRDARYLPGFGKHYVDLSALPARHGYISFHACTPAMMRQLQEANPRPSFLPVRVAQGEGPINEKDYAAILNAAAAAQIEQPVTIQCFTGPRILIGILSCHQRTPGPQAQRRTWLQDVNRLGIEYRFFLGALAPTAAWDPRRPAEQNKSAQRVSALPDQVFLDVPDTYRELPQKTRGMIRWAYERGYDFLFKCDDDTYVQAERLLHSDFAQYDYCGFARTTLVFGSGKEVTHAQGGAGYWLSRKAMALILKYDSSMEGAEDINVARVLFMLGILPAHDARYQPAMVSVPMPSNNQITAHDCSVEDFYEIHSKFEFYPSAARPKGLSPELSESDTERVGVREMRT